MRNIISAFCILFFAACANNTKPPGGIIQPDTMRNVMWDMIQADQYAKQYLVNDSSKFNVKAETIKLYEQVFLIHHITKEQFDKSYQYYITHEDQNRIIFDSLSAQNLRQRHQPVPLPRLTKPSLKVIK
jgi:hypothetical protein